MHKPIFKKDHDKTHFFDLFPTPRFLEMSAPGIAIEDTAIRYVEFSRKKEGLVLEGYDLVSIPEGVIVSGEVIKKDVLISLLSGLKEKHNLNYVRCVIPEEKGYIFRTRIPKASASDINTAVEFVIEENVPVSVREAVFDYSVVESEDEQENDIDVSVTVVPENIVSSYMDIFSSAGMTPLHFEMESQAILKASIHRENNTPHLMVHFFDKKICVAIASDGVINFSSTVAFSGEEVSVEIKTKDKKNNNFSKKITGAVFDEFKSETNKIISYWNSKFEKLDQKPIPISSVVVSGHSADEADILNKLNELGLEVSIANVWINAFSFDSFIPPIPKSESLEYAVAVGLALPHHFHF